MSFQSLRAVCVCQRNVASCMIQPAEALLNDPPAENVPGAETMRANATSPNTTASESNPGAAEANTSVVIPAANRSSQLVVVFTGPLAGVAETPCAAETASKGPTALSPEYSAPRTSGSLAVTRKFIVITFPGGVSAIPFA